MISDVLFAAIRDIEESEKEFPHILRQLAIREATPKVYTAKPRPR